MAAAESCQCDDNILAATMAGLLQPQHDINFGGDTLLPVIETPVSQEGSLCIVDDKSFGVLDITAAKLKGAFFGGRPLNELRGSQFDILPEDLFVLAMSGVIPGRLTYVPMTGSVMAAAYRTAHSHAYPARSYNARQFLNKIRSAIHQYNVDTLLNLVLIGVADAVCKLKRFQFLCALYVAVGQLSFGTAISLTVDVAVFPQTSTRLIALHNLHLLGSTKECLHDMQDVSRSDLNLASHLEVINVLCNCDCNVPGNALNKWLQ